MQTFFREDHRLHFLLEKLSLGDFITASERPTGWHTCGTS